MSIREELQMEIEETRQAFHALLVSIPDESPCGYLESPG